MKNLAFAAAVFGVLAVVPTLATAADGHGRYGAFGYSHGQLHDDLDHRAFHRQLEHREAHRYPMTWRQHGQLHDSLRHDAFHDRLDHGGYHRQYYYSPYRTYFPGAYYPSYPGYYGYGYSRPGFYLYFGR